MAQQPATETEELDLGDTVRLETPYVSAPAGEESGGTYTHGIIVEVLTRESDSESRPTRVSLHLFNPVTDTLYIRDAVDKAIPQHVDFASRELVLVHKAGETYENHDPAAEQLELVEHLPPDDAALWQRVKPILDELEERNVIDTPYFRPATPNRAAQVVIAGEESNELGLALKTAERAGWYVERHDEQEDGEHVTYTLSIRDHDRLAYDSMGADDE